MGVVIEEEEEDGSGISSLTSCSSSTVKKSKVCMKDINLKGMIRVQHTKREQVIKEASARNQKEIGLKNYTELNDVSREETEG